MLLALLIALDVLGTLAVYFLMDPDAPVMTPDDCGGSLHNHC